MIDETEAYDEVCAFFNDAWENSIDWLPMDDGQMPVILWDGRQTEAPATDKPFIRFTMQPVLAYQATLAGPDKRKYENEGIISVQCFGPLQWNDGFEVAKYVAIMAKRVFQGKATPNGIWFRNCRTNRVGPSGGWFQFNTIIEYQFDEQR